MKNEATIQFIREHAADDVRMLALRKSKYPDVDMDFALLQIEGKQRTREKLPEIHAMDDWYYPVRLSLEQCSSETTAKYKANILSAKIKNGANLIDLTGGFGIDTFYLSQLFQETNYVERNAELCKIAEHNFSLTKRNIIVHNAQAEDFLTSQLPNLPTAIYLDPARRSASGGKVFRLQDCEPDLTALYLMLMSKCEVLMVKLSPMLDITEALRHLPDAQEVHIVAVKNEVKEVLIVCNKDKAQEPIKRIAVNLDTKDTPFIFLAEEESAAPIISPHGETGEGLGLEGAYLYEPNTAILKAGAFCTIAVHYGLTKLAPNTHLYASTTLIEDFPGRVFKVVGTPDKSQLKTLQKTGAHTICRNYPLSSDKLAVKYKIKEGGTFYLIGTTCLGSFLSVGKKSSSKTTLSALHPVLLLTERVK